jgi:hypothetical protein
MGILFGQRRQPTIYCITNSFALEESLFTKKVAKQFSTVSLYIFRDKYYFLLIVMASFFIISIQSLCTLDICVNPLSYIFSLISVHKTSCKL